MAEKKKTSILIDPALWERVKDAAKADRRSASQAVEEALETYCRKVERERGKDAA